MTRVAITRARVKDASAVAAFQQLAWQQTYRGVVDDVFLDAPLGDRVERWTERIRSGSRAVTIAWAGEVAIGVASTSIATPALPEVPPLELNSLYLRRDVQGTGLGSRLLRAAIGDDDAHLLVVDVNERARRFYERHGFRPGGAVLTDPGTGLTERRWVRRESRHEIGPRP